MKRKKYGTQKPVCGVYGSGRKTLPAYTYTTIRAKDRQFIRAKLI